MPLLTLNELEKATPLFCGKRGNAFCMKVMRILSINKVNDLYDHIDGVMLVDLFGHIRPDYKVMVNKFLERIDALGVNFICVTPTGEDRTTPTRDSIQGIKDAIALIRPLRDFSHSFALCGHTLTYGALDYIGILIIIILALMHLTTVRKDIKDYAKIDPMPKRD